MIPCDVLEKPGGWRRVSLAIIIVVSFGPALPSLWIAVSEGSWLLGAGFGTAIWRSFVVAIAVALSALLVGIPAGLLSAFYDFPGRRLLLALLAIPLLVPSFLWAIGLSQARIEFGLPRDSLLSGATGTVFAFAAPALPLVTYMTLVSARRLSKAQVDAVRLIGGELFLLFHAARAVLPGAIVAAVLAGILTLSDPGPGQILGYPGIAYEILVSFSASYDFALAARQSAFLTGIVLLIAIPIAVFIAPRVAAELLGKDMNPPPLARHRHASWIGLCSLVCIVLLTTILPLLGIVRPLFVEFPAARAFSEISRTLGNTLLYALTAGVVATGIGTWFTLAVGRENLLRRYALIGIFLILSLPPSLNALGIVQLGTIAPAWFDPLLRSRLTVGLALALRFLPIATILLMRSFGSTSPSQCLVGAVHGVPLLLYLGRVLGLIMLPAAAVGCAVVALEATAEVGTTLLLRPPGADSIPVQIFTVMANAPEALVAALCFFYFVGAAILLLLGWTLAGRMQAK
jgi:iron(III) transport system permease protein